MIKYHIHIASKNKDEKYVFEKFYAKSRIDWDISPIKT